MPLNSSLNVPCGWPRQLTSLPNSTTWPLPTGASTIETASLRYCWPHAQPLRSGVWLYAFEHGVRTKPERRRLVVEHHRVLAHPVGERVGVVDAGLENGSRDV